MNQQESFENLRENFIEVRHGRFIGRVHKSWASHANDPATFALRLQSEGGALLRDGGGQGVTSRVEMFGETVFRKVYLPGRWGRRLRDLVGLKRSLREWEANCACAAAGIHTATILAACTDATPLRNIHYVITAHAPGRDMKEILSDPNIERAGILRELGAYIRSIHDKGFFHAHLHTPHIFRDDAGRFTLIDLEASRISPPLSASLRDRNLRQIRKSLSKTLQQGELTIFETAYSGR